MTEKDKKTKVVIVSGSKYMPCSLSSFVVNGIDADQDDFGDIEQDPQEEQYTCDNRRFVSKLPTQIVLDKYKIDLPDYSEICDELKSTLYVGHCGMCI
jgi:hypothetical protein